mgnify:CR=1 FL=1
MSPVAVNVNVQIYPPSQNTETVRPSDVTSCLGCFGHMC